MWPEGFAAALAIGVDDIHPESSRAGFDCGGDLDAGRLGMLVEFLERYSLKATLFVTPSHTYRPQILGTERLHNLLRMISSRTESTVDNIFSRLVIKTFDIHKFDITNEEHKGFVTYLKGLVERGIIEIGIHGCFHFHKFPPYSAEFKQLNERHARERIETATSKFLKAGLPFLKGFAPPGWGVNESLLKVLCEEGFKYIAGSGDFSKPMNNRYVLSKEAGLKGVPIVFPSTIMERLVNIPRNWTPSRNDPERALKIIDLGGLVSVHMHVEDRYYRSYLGNGISPDNIIRLEKLIDSIENIYGKNGYVWFTAYGEIVRSFVDQKR